MTKREHGDAGADDLGRLGAGRAPMSRNAAAGQNHAARIGQVRITHAERPPIPKVS